jgi:hypothetical protein
MWITFDAWLYREIRNSVGQSTVALGTVTPPLVLMKVKARVTELNMVKAISLSLTPPPTSSVCPCDAGIGRSNWYGFERLKRVRNSSALEVSETRRKKSGVLPSGSEQVPDTVKLPLSSVVVEPH